MKPLTKRGWAYVMIAILFVACNNETKKQFEVSGTIKNTNAKSVYLEEVSAASSQGTIVDSSAIGKDGHYRLKAGTKESVVYNIRFDQNNFPLAAVINDVSKITVNIEMSKEDSRFAEKYDVKGSPVSQEMKDFMYSFRNDLQKVYAVVMKMDSLHKQGIPDSVLMKIDDERQQLTGSIRDFSLNALKKANDPALLLFELGYYQSAARERNFGLHPIYLDELEQLLTDATKRFPSHQGLKAVKESVSQELAKSKMPPESKWLGKPAPDFSLPDASGKQISLSSFKGKYVLVDFWASWCGPCREENPNVVKAYNRFRDKNFTILGVSLDKPDGKDNWLKAVMKDHLTWTQVSDLKWWDSPVVPMYGFDGIPYNVLLDPEGVVIGEQLRGRALEAKLEDIFK